MHFAAQAGRPAGILHEPRGGVTVRNNLGRGNLLVTNISARGAQGWHGSGDIVGMIPLLLTFFLIGTLMCGLIALELQPDNEPAPRRRAHRSRKYSHPATSKLELTPDNEVEFGHTAKGSAHGK